MAIFDIVGRRWSDGTRVLAQCKKGPNPVAIDPNFLAACEGYRDSCHLYYFAYGGCVGAPPWVTVVSGNDMLTWFESTEDGRRYFELLRGIESLD